MAALNLIPAQLEGQEFLASSHYKLSHDKRFIPASLKSTFHKHYVPPRNNLKPEPALPPKPSDFMHQDVDKINMKVSETCQAFPEKQSIYDDPRDKYSALYKTNFKMDSDNRLNLFTTTHERYYKPNTISGTPWNPSLSRIWTKSSLPQGDKEKAEDPVSNYRSSFLGHDASKNQVRRNLSTNVASRPTITGNGRRLFDTTHCDTFKGTWIAPLPPVQKHTVSSIPEGDKEKVFEDRTTMRRSFTQKQLASPRKDEPGPYQKLYATNYKEKDGLGKFDKYLTTEAESYQPIQNGNSGRVKRDRDRNASDIPDGDMNAYRANERISTTLSRMHYQPLDIASASMPKVDGSKLRTKSNVRLSEHGSRFYETTCDSTYHPVTVSYVRADSHPKSVVPLKYYGDQKTNPTTRSDFPSYDTARLKPHPIALENLRMTHFNPPLGQERYFSTTQDSHYTPKEIVKLQVDPGRLQRSTVPIGTMGKFIKDSHNGWE